MASCPSLSLSFFCTINPLDDTVTMNAYNFQRLIEICDILDDVVTPARASMTFFVCGKLKPDKIYDFAASAKDMEKREQAARLASLQRQRRDQAALQAAAVAGLDTTQLKEVGVTVFSVLEM